MCGFRRLDARRAVIGLLSLRTAGGGFTGLFYGKSRFHSGARPV